MINKDEKSKTYCVFACLIKKIKCAAKSKNGAILRLNKKTFEDEELPHELFVTTRETIKIRNVIPINLSTNIKLLSKEQILEFSQGNETVFKIMANDQNVRIKIRNAQLNKLNRRSTMLRLNKKKLSR